MTIVFYLAGAVPSLDEKIRIGRLVRAKDENGKTPVVRVRRRSDFVECEACDAIVVPDEFEEIVAAYDTDGMQRLAPVGDPSAEFDAFILEERGGGHWRLHKDDVELARGRGKKSLAAAYIRLSALAT